MNVHLPLAIFNFESYIQQDEQIFLQINAGIGWDDSHVITMVNHDLEVLHLCNESFIPRKFPFLETHTSHQNTHQDNMPTRKSHLFPQPFPGAPASHPSPRRGQSRPSNGLCSTCARLSGTDLCGAHRSGDCGRPHDESSVWVEF